MKTKEEIIEQVTGVSMNPKRDINILCDPADIIECMESYAEQRVEEASKWIPIKLGGEYPEYMETVIIHAELGFVGQAQFGGSTTHPVFSIGDEWHKATHWQPLPKAPTV